MGMFAHAVGAVIDLQHVVFWRKIQRRFEIGFSVYVQNDGGRGGSGTILRVPAVLRGVTVERGSVKHSPRLIRIFSADRAFLGEGE